MKNVCEKCCSMDTGIFLIRLSLAVVFMFYGYSKLTNLEATAGFFGDLGFIPFFAYLVAAIEFFGGLFLLLGVMVRTVGVLLAIIMLVAAVKVTFPMGFVGGYELNFILFMSALAVAFSGAGRYSLSTKKPREVGGSS